MFNNVVFYSNKYFLKIYKFDSIYCMRIIGYDKYDEVVDLLLTKARYQKVLFCYDESCDYKLLNKIIDKVNKLVVVIKVDCNQIQLDEFRHMCNNGVKVVVHNIKVENYYKLFEQNIYLLNVFIATGNYILPYMMHNESVYGENVLMCDTNKKDLLGVMMLYDAGLNYVWTQIQQRESVKLDVFKQLDGLVNFDKHFYSGYLEVCLNLKKYIFLFKDVGSDNLHMYLLIKYLALFEMFNKINNGEERYVDFYKTEKTDVEISKAYHLVIKSELIDLLRLNSVSMLRIINAIINRYKILIKKHFKYKNIKINKIKNKLINIAKQSKIDNLLYISYIFNTI